MPSHQFNDSFFHPAKNLIDTTSLQDFLSLLYDSQSPLYFSSSHVNDPAQDLQKFKNSSSFLAFQFQYVTLLNGLNDWCDLHIEFDYGPIDETQEARIERYTDFLTAINQDGFTKQPLKTNAKYSHLKTHVLVLLKDDIYSTLSILFFNEGKKSLEILLYLMRHPDVPLEKKKAVMLNLCQSILSCGEGALTHIIEAKDEILALQDSATLLVQAKQTVIRHLALFFHNHTPGGQVSSSLREEDRKKRIAFLRSHEVHFISHYMDTVVQKYGLPLRQDRFKLDMDSALLSYFPIYLDAQISPSLIIENLHTQFELLFLKLHEQVQALLGKRTSFPYQLFQQQFESKLNGMIDHWNRKYGILCELDLYCFVDINDKNQVFTIQYDAFKFKINIAKRFEKNYLSPEERNTTFHFCSRTKEAAQGSVVRYLGGVAWQETSGDISPLTLDSFLHLQIPEPNSPEVINYWSTLHHLWPSDSTLFYSKLQIFWWGEGPHSHALEALKRNPALVARLTQLNHTAFFSMMSFNEPQWVNCPLNLAKDAQQIKQLFSAPLFRNSAAESFRSAASENRIQDLVFLGSRSPDVLNKQDPITKKTALHLAIENSHVECMLILLEMGARIDVPNAQAKTARDLFLSHQAPNQRIHVKLWRYLKLAKTSSEQTFLVLADDHGIETFEKMNHYSFNQDLMNRQDSKGFTLLHKAVEKNNRELIQMLLNQGANPHIPDHHGLTAFQLAQRNHLKSLFISPQQLHRKADLIKKLHNYIAHRTTRTNYLKLSSPALNQQVNIELARRLVKRLQANITPHEIGLYFSSSHIALMRREVIDDLNCRAVPHFIERSIDHSSLQNILVETRLEFPIQKGLDERMQLKDALSAYIKRATHPHSRFYFFSEPRSKSRQANVGLARALIKEIDQQETSDLPTLFSASRIQSLRDAEAKKLKLDSYNEFICSDELNGILKLGRKI